jgi:GntR family transcriptional regulator
MSPKGYETSARIIGLEEGRASQETAEALNITRSTKVIELKRIRYLNREPISFDISYFPANIGHRLAGRDLTKDVFPMLENELGIMLSHADLVIESVTAEAEHAEYLNVAEGSPILNIKRLVYSKSGDPVDFEYISYRGDAFQYQLRVDR